MQGSCTDQRAVKAVTFGQRVAPRGHSWVRGAAILRAAKVPRLSVEHRRSDAYKRHTVRCMSPPSGTGQLLSSNRATALVKTGLVAIVDAAKIELPIALIA